MVLVGSIGAVSVSTNQQVDDQRSGSARRSVDAAEQLGRLHAAGVTGENVSVGVVGVTGFDTEHSSLSGRVVAARAFAAGETVRNGGRNEHGTAAASLVAQTAPDARLSLATFDTISEFERAVIWLVRQDVDVIVAPVAFYGKPGDGSSRAAAVVRSAVQNGTAFVAPAGNLGLGHWQGEFDPTGEGRHRFDGGTRNYLLGNDRQVTLWLSWDRSLAERDFTVELYAINGVRERLVARSQPYRGDTVPNERIVAALEPDETYYYVLRGPENASGASIEVSSPTHAFEFRERAGSVVPPATARDAISVGAYDGEKGRVEPFSSAGPVVGRRGVDIVAPDRLRAAGEPGGLVGSSAAAPYVAGVVALMLDVNSGLSPERVEEILTGTATDAGKPGPDSVAGEGRIEPHQAVERARNASQRTI